MAKRHSLIQPLPPFNPLKQKAEQECNTGQTSKNNNIPIQARGMTCLTMLVSLELEELPAYTMTKLA